MRARLLLTKQDELSLLEEQLDEIDRTEVKKIYLGNMRQEGDGPRKHVLQRMDLALKDYGTIPSLESVST
jgi:hypothetical protein